MQWLRRYFITGFFVTVPLVISVAALVWIFDVGRRRDGAALRAAARAQGAGLGLLTTMLLVLLAGVVATNVIGRRLLQRAEHYLMMVPVFRTIYAPVKQLILAFSPDNEAGFKRVVLVDDPARGLLLGFLTREFTVDTRTGPPRAHGGGLCADQSPLSGRRAGRSRPSEIAFPTSPWSRASASS